MIKLIPMSATEYEDYLARTVPEYADEKVKAGNWSSKEALQKAQESYQQLLPDRVATPNQYLYTIQEITTGKAVGMIWMAVIQQPDKKTGFIYDLFIEEAARQRGYGGSAMLALEEEARAIGVEKLALHVFGHNHAAQALYTKLGYEITNINMAKSLTS